MSDTEIGILGLLISAVLIAGFIWYWRSTEWDNGKGRPDKRRYCTRCGTTAEPRYYREGSLLVELFLLLMFLVPGIFYHFWRRSKEYWGCPKCKASEII